MTLADMRASSGCRDGSARQSVVVELSARSFYGEIPRRCILQEKYSRFNSHVDFTHATTYNGQYKQADQRRQNNRQSRKNFTTKLIDSGRVLS